MGKYAREQAHGSQTVAPQQCGVPTTDIEQRLREAMDGVTPGPWVAKQTVIHGNEYGGWWLEGIDLDPEDATRPERLVLISGSGGARSYTTRIIDRQIHDDNEANMKWFALCSPDNIGALLAERAADRATIASLRSKLEEAEGALPPVKPLDLANVIRDAFLAGAGMDTSKRETQRIPEDVYERLNKYDPEHVPAFKRLEALLSATYRARRTLASLREADHA